ncbi:MAG: hypothetical protein PCFJNLEI_00116 [Verrucomicrobiae bacterium]|nr:hypothetical protein [Verrucomicrobiae bacterium]
MKKRPLFQRGFTLVELLVVVTLIAVLAALLMPALATAKARSKDAQCANNERQLGVGFSGYLNDNNGAYPYANPECACTNAPGANGESYCPTYQGTAYCVTSSDPTKNAGGWNYVIAPYLGCPLSVLQKRIACNTCGIGGCCPSSVTSTYASYSKLLQCPANAWRYPGGGYRLSASNYQMNLDLFPLTWRCGGASSCGAGPTSPQNWSRRVNMSDLNYGSSAMLLGEIPLDGSSFGLANPWGQANGGAWGYTLPYGGATGLTPLQVTNAWNIAWTGVNPDPRIWLRNDCNAFVAAWHNLGMNVLFVDGHVDRVTKTTLLQYSKDMHRTGPNGTPGGLFWTDGKGVLNVSSNGGETQWYDNQYPGASYPN